MYRAILTRTLGFALLTLLAATPVDTAAAETIEVFVPDMHCTGCANVLREKLMKEPGVSSARSSFRDKTITIVRETSTKPDDDRIRATIAEMKYTVAEIRPGKDQ